MRRALLVIGLVLVVGAAALAALPFLLTPASLAAQLQQAVKSATGRTLELAGRPRLSLWPEIAIELDGVELSNPPGMFKGRIAAVERLRVKVALGPLLRGEIDVKELVAVRPKLSLVVDGEGRSNFAFASATADQPANRGGGSAGPADLRMPPLIIEDGEFKYIDERSGTALAVSNVDLVLAPSSPGGPVEATGALVWNDQRLALTLYVKSPGSLAADGSPIDMTINGPLVSAAFSGRARLSDGLALAGTVELSTPSLAQAARWAKLPVGEVGLDDFSAAGSLDLSRRHFRIKEATLKLGRTNAHGDLALSLSGPRPLITGSIGVDRIATGGGAMADSGQVSAASRLQAGWSTAPISFEALKGLDARLSLTASEIVVGRMTIGGSRLDVRLNGGVLEVDLADMAFYGGSAAGRLVLDGSGKSPAVTVDLKANGIDGGRLVADAAALDRITGKADIEIDVSANGASELELVSMLKGGARLRFVDGAVHGLDLPHMVRELHSRSFSWIAKAESATRFSSLRATFTVEDGIADTQDLELLGPHVQMTGKGSIDLLRQRLDLKVRPTASASQAEGQVDEAAAALPVAVIVAGHWSAPKIYPDITSILDDPNAALKSLKRHFGKGKAVDLDDGAGKVDKAKAKKAGKALLKRLTGSGKEREATNGDGQTSQ